MNNILIWIQEWYKSQCNGDWEHQYGLTIDTLDNPGWSIEIDLAFTTLEKLVIDRVFVEKNENDWFYYTVSDAQYIACGDPNKLEFLLERFKEIVDSNISQK
ncbi:MAG: immunity 53 family protein [Chitinophagaceae bacterium]|nr:immunity 53 family protein [Chitinophagaceae bacterium]